MTLMSRNLVTDLPYPRHLSVHAVFERMAQVCPDAPALVFGQQIVTYRELDQRTNQLARRFAALGAGPGKFVGLLTQRSIETVVAWLATLKCGAAYLPLDPTYPAEALRNMIDDAGPVVVMGERELISAALGADSAGILIFEDQIAQAQSESREPLGVEVAPRDPAYVMYTSGSTGRPKGVVVPHRAVVRLVRQQNYMTFGHDEAILMISALAFDVSTWEVWGALLNGGRLCIIRSLRPTLPEIAQAIRQYDITSIYFTSALFNLFVDQQVESLLPVRQILVGGEAMSASHTRRAIAALPKSVMINAYGPTEATTYCVCYRVALDGLREGGGVPIGIPLAHDKAYILDDNLKPVQPGTVGMLWAAGDGVALGYLKRPELTAERFRKDPFSDDPEAAMYMTGDLARLRPDGLIECLGRNDRQVKINGKRIELDEIEVKLRRDPRVLDAVVALRERPDGEKRIAAFVKPAKPAPNGASQILARSIVDDFAAKEPPHMVPHELHVVPAMPLTSNGKVDRKALLAMPAAPAAQVDTRAKSDLERALAEIWAAALNRTAVPVDANFFDLGGTSIQMLKVHAEIVRGLALDCTLPALFEHPTIEALARHFGGQTSKRDAVSQALARGARVHQRLRHVALPQRT